MKYANPSTSTLSNQEFSLLTELGSQLEQSNDLAPVPSFALVGEPNSAT